MPGSASTRCRLGEGYKRFRVIYGNDQPVPRTLEVRLDAVDGPLVGEVSLPQTDIDRVAGQIQIYAEATGAISPTATGTHDVFLVFRAPEGQVGEFEYFRFEQYRGQIPLNPTRSSWSCASAARMARRSASSTRAAPEPPTTTATS